MSTVSSDYLKLKDSKAQGGASFFAGTHSEDVSGNSGWKFENPVGKPAITTGSAPILIGATLEGIVNPAGAETTYWFEYGETTAYEHGKTTTAKLTGSENKAVSKEISGLVNGTTYHYRLVAENAQGGAEGLDQIVTPTKGSAFFWIS